MIAAAGRAGAQVVAQGVLARHASYDPETRFLNVELANGAVIGIPIALIDVLAQAPDAARAEVEVSGIGYGLHWPSLDLDLSVPGLLAGVFGTGSWMNRQRAARAGAATSAAKAAAARQNGAKGGRPRKPVA